MKDFMMLFHSEPSPNLEPTPEDIQQEVKKWQDWIGGIAAQGKLKSPGDALGFEGKTLHEDGNITDGPYMEVKEMIGGYTIVTTETIEEAVELAKGCPVLEVGGKVEVRDVMVFDDF